MAECYWAVDKTLIGRWWYVFGAASEGHFCVLLFTIHASFLSKSLSERIPKLDFCVIESIFGGTQMRCTYEGYY